MAEEEVTRNATIRVAPNSAAQRFLESAKEPGAPTKVA